MKQSARVVILAVLLCSAFAFGGIVNYAEMGLAQGGTAVYDASAGTIVWSGGASGRIGLTNGTFINFNQPDAGVTITGNVSGAPGSGTSISMTDLEFALSFAPYGTEVTSAIVISGSLTGSATYDETLQAILPGGAFITGVALVDVTMSVIDVSETFEWIQPTGSQLTTSIIGLKNFTNYSQDYTTQSLVIKVFGEVPEPATMSLLVIGAVGMLIKRKK